MLEMKEAALEMSFKIPPVVELAVVTPHTSLKFKFVAEVSIKVDGLPQGMLKIMGC
jgi:hypothetical protein